MKVVIWLLRNDIQREIKGNIDIEWNKLEDHRKHKHIGQKPLGNDTIKISKFEIVLILNKYY